MSQEFIAQVATEQKVSSPEVVRSFQIQDRDSYQEWNKDIWPGLERLFATTWPTLLTREFKTFFTNAIAQSGGAAILMQSSNSDIIGASFIYPVAQYLREQQLITYPKDGAVAYNSTVIVDPRYRGQGLMIPLLEETLSEASDLGYDYVVGHYNRATGMQRPDGRRVENGFAHRIKEHNWQHGRIIFPTFPVEFKHPEGIEYSENILFQLPKRQLATRPSMRRMPLVAVA